MIAIELERMAASVTDTAVADAHILTVIENRPNPENADIAALVARVEILERKLARLEHDG